MQFVADGPNIPPELVAAQEKGQTIFVCGAGVSRGAGLPLFSGLVQGVYDRLGEDWNLHPAEREGMRAQGKLEGQYDRVLRCLERRLMGPDAPRNRGMRDRIRSAVREELKAPDNADLSNHFALLELSRDAEGRNRILTTNFDTLFERAWFEKHHTVIPTHAGAAMPQPKVAGCTGVLHLHGRLSDPRPELHATETELVLTSAEFGDAYLRSGWASRYIYDLVRAYTVVLVGYQADDPPMRYLLEALEADRERYRDLQKVYAFASCEVGDEELTRALWAAKAVEPIIYTSNGEAHTALYNTLREWRDYAEDPTAWRRERLRPILSEPPSAVADSRHEEGAELLGHGDASELLTDLCPEAEWLSVFVEKRVFGPDKSLPGGWIAKRIDDPSMIRACAALPEIDEDARWHINRALEGRPALTSVRAKAWRLMLAAKRPKPTRSLEDNWYATASHIGRGQLDFGTRQLICRLLRPRLEIDKSLRWEYEQRDPSAPEVLGDLFHVKFDPTENPTAKEILSAWPQNTEHETSLFQALNRTLLDALEEAHDLGLTEGWDRTSYDVPSVAAHPQNAYRSGFYSITRVLADLWHRIASRDPDLARKLAGLWASSSFLLVQRLSLFAYEHPAFTADEAAAAVVGLNDEAFWGASRVEIMRLLAGRWVQFRDADRVAIETRIREGEPRCLYAPDTFKNDEEWQSVHDSSIYRRLKRIELAGGSLTPESQRALAEISARHQAWKPGLGDRDDFDFWHETGSGPDGQPELLASIADEQLVKEAMRLQREQHFDQRDVWRVFCSADPERALRGLRLEAEQNQWQPEAWRSLLWAASDKDDVSFQIALADLLVTMPDAPLLELLHPATSWLQRRRAILSSGDQPEGARFLRLWDRFADLTYAPQDEASGEPLGDDLISDALNRPGGILAWSLLEALGSMKPVANSGFSTEFKLRFDRLANAPGRQGLLARVYLARPLAYLDAVDPVWVEANLQPRFSWEHSEALPLWRCFAHGSSGSARLFNALKPAILAAFERRELSDNEFEGLTSSKLLSIAIAHQRGEAAEYDLTTAEVRRALTVGPSAARRNVAWNFWRMMGAAGNEDGEEEDGGAVPDKATRWRTIVAPLFNAIWPLDVRLRSKNTSQNLVYMALECEDAFPEAVDAILDVIVPYQLYQISHSLRLKDKHGDLVRQYPLAFVKLVNAIVDPTAFPVPADLAALLEECRSADPAIVQDPAYLRLRGLSRQRGA
ncbi:SIR2 family protein [Afipia felis]